MDDYPFIRNVRSPITDDQLRPLDPRCQVVQFDSPLSESDFVRLSRFLKGNPDVPLRIYGHEHGLADLSFLSHFPFLKGFQANIFEIASWDGLECLPESLEFLGLGATRRRFSLGPIARFTRLTDLFIEGHTKDLSVLRRLTKLVYLTLRSVTMPDLSLLEPLQSLRSLSLKLGGTNRIDAVSLLPRLRRLELWRVRGLTDLTAVAEIADLRFLFLQDLKGVQRLPSFRPLRDLRRVHIETLKSLSDLNPIAEAPKLEELVLVNMRHLAPDSIECFRNHPTLRAAHIDIGSLRKNAAAQSLLECDRAEYFVETRSYIEGT